MCGLSTASPFLTPWPVMNCFTGHCKQEILLEASYQIMFNRLLLIYFINEFLCITHCLSLWSQLPSFTSASELLNNDNETTALVSFFYFAGPQTLSAMGCSKNLLSWKEFFLNGINLATSGRHENYVTGFQSCEVIPRSPMYYDSFVERWISICSEIFTVRFETGPGIILEVRFFYARCSFGEKK